MEFTLDPDHWDYLRSQSLLAREAHDRFDFALELRLQRDTIFYLVAILTAFLAWGRDESLPSHVEMLYLLHVAQQAGDDEIELAYIGSILTDKEAGLLERAILGEFVARYGVMTAVTGDIPGGLPWLRLADEYLQPLIQELAGAKEDFPAQFWESLNRLRYEVTTALEFAYRELGEGEMAEWPAFVRDHEAVRPAEQGEEYGAFVTAFHALNSAQQLQRQNFENEALELISAQIAVLAGRDIPSWLRDVMAAKRAELIASNAGDMLGAREAISRQLASIARSEVPIPPAILAGTALDALLYAVSSKQEALIFADAARVMVVAEKHLSGSVGVVWRALTYLAEWADAADKPWSACLFLKIAAARMRAATDTFRSVAADGEAEQDGEARFLYGELGRRLVRSGRFAEAAEAVELDLARDNAKRALSQTDAEAEAVGRIHDALRRAVADNGDDVGALASVLAEVAHSIGNAGYARDQAAAKLNAAIRARGTAALPEVRASTTALLHYIVDRSTALVLVQFAGRETAVTLDVQGGPEVNRLAFETLRAASNTDRDPIPTLRRAYDALLAPVADLLQEADRVLIAAPGALHGLPWGALHDGTGYVAERWSWVRATAPGVDLRRPPGPAMQVAACAMTKAAVGLAALGEAAAVEATAVVTSVAGARLVDDVFTRAALEQALRFVTILHVASHFEPDPVQLDRSRLLLGDGTTLTLSELAAMGLSGLDLVVLSACSSGVVDSVTAAEGAFAADAMLLGGGARSVVSTLWPADNGAMGELMGAFYQHLRAGRDKDTALAMAQRALIAGEIGSGGWRLPFYWSAPAFSGNWLGWA